MENNKHVGIEGKNPIEIEEILRSLDRRGYLGIPTKEEEIKKDTMIKRIFALVAIITIVPTVIYASMNAYEDYVIHHAISNWNASNDRMVRDLKRVQEAEKDFDISVKEEKDNFCFLVEVKKEYGLEVSTEGYERYKQDCVGLKRER